MNTDLATMTRPLAPMTAPARSADEALSLVGVRKDFGSVHAVRGVDLVVRRGEIVALLGPNGAGKTTTIELVLGLTTPRAGRVLVGGTTPARAVTEGRVAAVLQDGGLLDDLTVRETLRYVASIVARPQSVSDVLERCGITAIADRLVGRCAGGERQRLRFAMALLPDPDLLVLDEPTTGLDVEGRRRFWDAVREECGRGRTVLFATHYLEEANAIADRVVLLDHGVIVADGTPARIRSVVAGRTVRATLTAVDEAALLAIPGVLRVTTHHGTVVVRAEDSDAVARHLLTRTDAKDLEIVPADLQDAYLALTSPEVGHSTGLSL